MNIIKYWKKNPNQYRKTIFRERTKRKAVRSGVLRWPSGEIPYEFKWGAYSKKVSNWLSTEFEFNYIPNVFRLWHEIIFFPFCVIGNSEKYLIRVAMREWEKYTCLRFRKRQRENNYVMFQDNFGWAQKWYTRNILNAKRNENHL